MTQPALVVDAYIELMRDLFDVHHESLSADAHSVWFGDCRDVMCQSIARRLSDSLMQPASPTGEGAM